MPDTNLITTRQMRELHAALHDHGITGDQGVHAYLARALAELGADPVESRADLTTVHAAKIITDLTDTPPPSRSRMTPAKVRALRDAFPAEAQGKLPRSTCKDCSTSPRKRCEKHTWVSRCDVCRGSHSDATMHIDFIGHADVTARLLDVDPEWYWEPWTTDQVSALPPAYRNGLWVWLHVLGVRRAGFGHAENDRQRGGDEVKVAIGDALRNAAMRFGVALDLWAKGDRDWSAAAKADGYEDPPMDPPQPRAPDVEGAPRPWVGPDTATILMRLDEQAGRAGVTYEQVTAKWRAAHGNMTVDQLETVNPWDLTGLLDAVTIRANEVVAEREKAQADADAADAAKAANGDPDTADPSNPGDPWAHPGASGDQPPGGA